MSIPNGMASATSLPRPTFTRRIQWTLSIACGLLIANVYYAQPLTGLISAALHMPRQDAGLLVTLPLSGYGIGLLVVVPLGDLIENRRLTLALVMIEALCLALVSTLAEPMAFLAVAFMIGLSAAAVQILVPYVTYLASEDMRGQALGRVVSGVMLGIMLARPVSSMAAAIWSWHAIFRISAAAMFLLLAALRSALPERHPAPGLTYAELLRSMGRIFITTEILRRRAFYHATMFGAFSVFWTAVPLWLSGPAFKMSQAGIAWVALAGVAGAIAPPIAGRMADKGLAQRGTVMAMLMAASAFPLTHMVRAGSDASAGLVIAAAVILDFSVSANLVFGQRAIYALGAEQRSRINGLFMANFFAGGAVASALAGWVFARFGWSGVSMLGAGLPLVGMAYLATEKRAPA